ncbi:MAG: exo-alpha-sialidase [Ruminococcaceae bacterium]|nr:exo-alpha-sialidase [Oscillospiraceae bacterium]
MNVNVKKHVVSRDDSIYEAWPDLLLKKDGTLICVFSECEHHLNRDGARIAIVKSYDRGRSWTAKSYLTEKGVDGAHFNCARISELDDGRIAIICDKIHGNENRLAKIFVWFSEDGGESWSKPIQFDFCGIVPDKLRSLKSGRLIIAAHFKSDTTGKLEQYLWYSDDGGKHWSDRVTIAADPKYNLCEVSILECEGGKLVAFLRENSGLGYPIFKAISNDNGESWSPIYETSMDSGHRPVAAFLKDGRVMITYRYIPCGTQNLFAAFYDAATLFETERRRQRVRILPLDYDRNPSPDIGYTGWAQFDDGEIYVVNYIKDDADKAYIRGYSFYPEDVLFPENENTTKNVF